MTIEISERDKEIERKALDIFEKWPRTKIIFGPCTLENAGKIAATYGKSALIVIGGRSAKKYRYTDTLLASLDAAGVSSQIFEGVEPNPSRETVEDIAFSVAHGKFDVTIALGGGSAMDAAKAALILPPLGETDITPYFGVGNVSKKLNRISPCICIPTTSGTSAEVTRYSNITMEDLGLKKLISDIAIHPHVAIVDPELTLSCPKSLTTTVGLDTLTHLMEGYLNLVQDEGNEEINERALLGIELVFRWLKIASEEPHNKDARRMMSIASGPGGTVIGGEKFKGTGGPHMNSFSWAASIAHGNSTGIMLPYYIAYYGKNPKVIEKLRPVAKMLDVTEDGDLGLKVAQNMLNWYNTMGFPTNLKNMPGWKDEYYEKALKDAGQNAMKLKAMPNPVSLDEVNEIIGPIIKAAISGDLHLIQ